MSKQVALITGGMGGLGTALCRRLHREGFLVATTCSPSNGRRQAWLAAQRDEGVNVLVYEADVADEAACAQVAQRLQAETGRIDVLVNNAGITRDRSLRKMSADDWQAVLRTNLDSVFHMTRQVIEPMIARRWGRVINISSVNGQAGAFGQATRGGQGRHAWLHQGAGAGGGAPRGHGQHRVARLSRHRPMVAAVPDEVMKERILPAIPVGRLGAPEEVAGLVAYLVSDQAGYVTGANIAINGGQHMC